MPRTIPAHLQTEFNKSVTELTYLIQWNMASGAVYRWCNMGDFSYNGSPWTGLAFEITGLSFNPDQEPTATLSVQNVDGTAGALFQFEKMADATVDVFQFSPNAASAGDAPQLVRLVVDQMKIGLDVIEVTLVSYGADYAFSPRRRIDPANGFNFALPEGSQIVWENEVFIVQGEDNG